MVDIKAMSQPLAVKARMGVTQKIGLNMKLISRAETFLRKIKMAVKMLNGAKMSPSSLRAAISLERRLAMLGGLAKPNTRPMPNKKVAMKIHLL